jgi:hypothetical protein
MNHLKKQWNGQDLKLLFEAARFFYELAGIKPIEDIIPYSIQYA